ncbi:3-hydroxyacyl-CoA dehydrogenase NAD-binding domain-containing protein [Uliginosibacterium sp. H3]|uniref:3-hydroxyacyl-CoA dehydrogenase NAD-binding domain-containing protein n=1 Tax=Uliginosibacterium silvisoli TaxID=3114758 RepID=A0ABU6K7H8_9RHOO|nr:3-hydroxyacyl-CoA dehydrogenase NAD-binding domain-containing protein [Uliginosibacterium sp. H3]
MSATTMSNVQLKHWHIRRDADGIAWVSIDVADASTNTLGSAVLIEFGLVLDSLERLQPKGMVLMSGKTAGYIAGADLEEYAKVESVEGIKAIVGRNWSLFNRLEAVPWPTLALIRGHCMGGGLEISLACRYRIAVDEPGTRMALPEVMLGITPGWGGMLRLPRTIGPTAAMDMMLTGKQIDAKRAKKMGLVDECVPPRVMENAARMLVLSGQPRHTPGFVQGLLNGPLKFVVASGARKQVAKKARRDNYPAPYAIIDTWQHFNGNSLDVPPTHPASLEHIFAQGTARNLVRVFFLQQRLKSLGKGGSFSAKHVHVVGAGVMGGDIAAWCVLRGLVVTLQDQSIERIAPAIKRAAEGFGKKYRGDRKQVRFAMDRLIADPQGSGVAQADVIIEAIFENLDAKHALFRDLEARAKPGAILATNTSSLKLEDIATVLARPERLVGIHFFNPVAQMPLVEVVQGERTDAEVLSRAMAFVHGLDKLPLPVKSAPGFLVNAVLGPYLLEAMRCVDAGMSPETIDAAMLAFGMPMGPIELADTVGLDIAMATGKALTGASEVPRALQALVDAGKLGRKTGEGFYVWADGRPRKDGASAPVVGLAERLLEPLIAATRRCVDLGVVADAELADAGVIFGTGFAPWTGGPMNHFARREGQS